MINWKVRMRNPMFWAQILLSVITPILAYLGLTAEDLSSWSVLGEVLIKAVSSPYILSLVIVSVYNAITDRSYNNRIYRQQTCIDIRYT